MTKIISATVVATLFLGLTQQSLAQTGQWKLAGNSLNGTQKLGSTNNFSLDFITNNVKRMSLTNTGNLRFNSDQSFIQFPNPGASPKPMMFMYESGNINTARMVLAYSPAFPNYGLKYNGFDKFNFTDGTFNALNVDLTRSSIGIGTTNNENFKLKIVHGNNLLNGLAIENSTLTGIEWSLFTGGGNGPLNFIRDGAIMGQISFPSGQYLALSDERLKTNIRPMSVVLDKISRLKPSSYQFKNATNKQDYDGFIAQEVMKIFPALVTHTVDAEAKIDVYTMDYSGFGVIAVKAIQELMLVIKEQEKRILALEQSSNAVTSNSANNSSISKNNMAVAGASLEQNQPNPFKSITTIRYQVPQGSKAQLHIYNASGNLVKTFSADESGQAVINAGELSAGTYTYDLIINGKQTASKKMVLLK